MKIPATVTVLTYNSAKTLETCLSSVAAFDDLLVLDGGSTDETVAIAQRLGARVIPQADQPGPIRDFTAVRERSFAEAQYDWILWMDSDEWADARLIEAIARAARSLSESVAYTVDRVPLVQGKKIRYDEKDRRSGIGAFRRI